MNKLQLILMSVQLLVALCTLLGMAYAFKKFLSKPKDSMIERIVVLEAEMKDVKAALNQGNDRFRKQNDTNEVILHSILALIDFEMQYCLTEKVTMSDDLKYAKEDLQRFLSKRGERI
jgi:hypothetical protein